MLAIAVVACGNTEQSHDAQGVASVAPGASAAPEASFAELEHATNVLRSERPFSSRAQAVTIADRLALAAEGKPDAVARRAAKVIGDVRLRSYRTFHEATDAREAIVQYENASKSADPELACASELEAWVLRAEVEDDPRAAYVGLFKASRRDDASPCDAAYRRALRDLDAYRPDPVTLAALEQDVGSTSKSKADGPGETVVKPSAKTKPGPAKLKSIETFSARDAARVVIHLTGPIMYDVGTVSATDDKGPRLYVDLHETKRGKAPRLREVDGLVQRVRVGAHKSKTRVVLDLSQRAYRRVFYLPEPFRVLIDISTSPPRRKVPSATATGQRRVRRVVLDPGHGGSDPGAIGPGGLREKDVTLDIAHRVAPILSRELGMVTMLTRDDDRYVPLEERAARANAFHADLFVSVHCNAAEDPEHRGVQTFVLARAADEAALRLAARENASTAAAGHQVGAMLADLQVESLSRQSSQLAALLQRATMASLAESYDDAPDGGVRSATFFVLLGAQMPAVLFEASFISNPHEESRLATADYRQKLADGIANAIRAYRDGR
ncbi:MAG: N-acetylmuramoyl-L-alanine amidase [Myxococcota bacterium]